MTGGEEWENKHMQKSLYVFSVIILVVMVLVCYSEVAIFVMSHKATEHLCNTLI